MNANADYPAFPSTEDTYAPGLTKREYFAAAAMQGMLSNPDLTRGDGNPNVAQNTFDLLAKASVACADALIAELSKEESK